MSVKYDVTNLSIKCLAHKNSLLYTFYGIFSSCYTHFYKSLCLNNIPRNLTKYFMVLLWFQRKNLRFPKSLISNDSFKCSLVIGVKTHQFVFPNCYFTSRRKISPPLSQANIYRNSNVFNCLLLSRYDVSAGGAWISSEQA